MRFQPYRNALLLALGVGMTLNALAESQVSASTERSVGTQATTSIQATKLYGKLEQGGMVVGRSPQGTQVWFEGRPLRVSPEGVFVFGLNYDQKNTAKLKIQQPGRKASIQTLHVAPRQYDIQRIDGIEQRYVSPPESVWQRIKNETAQIVAAKKRNMPQTDFLEPFRWPVHGVITGVFGSQRILNGVPKRPHFGIDIAVPENTAVRAPASGVITVAHPDMYYSGGTLLLDHGHGVQSVFMHLNKLFVEKNDYVTQGSVIALSGSTGRSTGPHLDWRVNWFDQRIDAANLVGPMPNP